MQGKFGRGCGGGVIGLHIDRELPDVARNGARA